MPTVGKGMEEIRVSESSCSYRVIPGQAGLRPFTFPTHSRRRRKRRPGAIFKPRGEDSSNYWEAGNEETKELRERLGRHRGHAPTGRQPARTGRTNAENRCAPETKRVDTGRSGWPLRGDPATHQRSASRTGVALFARRVGEHCDRARLPRTRRSGSCLSRVLPALLDTVHN